MGLGFGVGLGLGVAVRVGVRAIDLNPSPNPNLALPLALILTVLLNAGWEEVEDEGGQVYYYNEATGESRWEQPEEEEVPNPSPNLPWARRDP